MKTGFYLIAALLCRPCSGSTEETNGYSTIWQRNVFGLKARPVAATPAPARAQLTRVKLAGIAALAPTKWAVLWIQEPGKPATAVALKEGACVAAVEVVSIDAPAGQVKVRNAGVEMTVAFENNGTGHNAALEAEDNHKPVPVLPSLETGDL